jgi:amidase
LHGVPIGVKDIIATADLPTEMGSPIYRGHRPTTDAACVAWCARAGAVILGKTVTCEFAGMAPGATTNPAYRRAYARRLVERIGRRGRRFHGPGGIRHADRRLGAAPGSYCGVFGFKPTFGAFNRNGVYPAARKPRHARADRAARSTTSSSERRAGMRTPSRHSPLDRARASGCAARPCGTRRSRRRWPRSRMRARLDKAGARCGRSSLPDEFAGLRNAARETINNYERAAAMAHEWNNHRERISDRLRKRIEIGAPCRYATTSRPCARGRLPRPAAAVFGEVDVLLTPCVTGEAPRGLDETGDPGFQAIWTILHTPALTLPTHRGPRGCRRHPARRAAFRRSPAARLRQLDLAGTRLA